MDSTSLLFVAFAVIQTLVIARVMLRPGYDPASRVAWVVVVAVLPVVGTIAYLSFGEVNFGRKRLDRVLSAREKLPRAAQLLPADSADWESGSRFQQLFSVGESVGGYPPVPGNRLQLVADSRAYIRRLVMQIDNATDHIHLEFYIWLTDESGTQVAEAMCRAARRGVTCRALADGMGCRNLIRSRHWQDMKACGVRLAVALPLGNPLLGPLRGRVDMRNHRKLAIIDNSIAWCGSQNCADPEFLVKARHAPWVDVMIQCEGPLVWQAQHLFAGDWMSATDENLVDMLELSSGVPDGGAIAQMIATGPDNQHSGMTQVFATLLYSARRRVTITTPYYVPNETIQSGLCACAMRGVETTLIVPRRNDSRFVGAASRSYYAELLQAGVHIHEFQGGLLHAKTFALDDEICLVGSANMDRRSFELNFENDLLAHDRRLAAELHRQHRDYLSRSVPVTLQEVRDWSFARRLYQNTAAILGPVL